MSRPILLSGIRPSLSFTLGIAVAACFGVTTASAAPGDPIGTGTVVSSGALLPKPTGISADAKGLLVVWVQGEQVLAQRLSSEGELLNTPVALTASAFAAFAGNNQGQAALLSYSSNAGSSDAIYKVTGTYLPFDALSLTPTGAAKTFFKASPSSLNLFSEAAVAIDPDGDALITWGHDAIGINPFDVTGGGYFGTPFGFGKVSAARYSAAGGATGESVVNTSGWYDSPDISNTTSVPTITADPSGGHLITYRHPTRNGYVLKAQRYRASGLAKGGAIDVSAPSMASRGAGYTAVAPDGSFSVAYKLLNPESDDYNPLHDIYLRRFDKTGKPLGEPVLINSGVLAAQAAIAHPGDQAGNSAVVWADASYRLCVQFFDAAGARKGETRCDFGTGYYFNASFDAQGNLVVLSNDSTSFDLTVRRYSGQ